MTNINAHFRFNKAGQGCFYTGRLKQVDGKRAFSMVYDCGTHSTKKYIREEINDFKEILSKDYANTLNLLVVSHFDDDHVNELKYLLKDLNRINYIFLPYLTPAERLAVYLSDSNKSTNADFQNFITNPVSFLIGLNDNIDKIVFVKGGEGGKDSNEVNVNNNPTGEGKFFEIKEQYTKSGSEEFIGNSTVSFINNNGGIAVEEIWEFLFYNKGIDGGMLASLVSALQKALPFLFNVSDFTQETLKEVFDSSKIEEIKTIYRKELKNQNLNPSSLIVYHGRIDSPKLDSEIECCYHSGGYCWHNIYPVSNHCSTLLTGDIFLAGLTFPPSIISKSQRIRFLQIPHHGSKTSWDISILSSLLNNGGKRSVNSIVNFGLGNQHKHPNQETLDSIDNEGWKIFQNNQLQAFEYVIYINFLLTK